MGAEAVATVGVLAPHAPSWRACDQVSEPASVAQAHAGPGNKAIVQGGLNGQTIGSVVCGLGRGIILGANSRTRMGVTSHRYPAVLCHKWLWHLLQQQSVKQKLSLCLFGPATLWNVHLDLPTRRDSNG